jgi:membrane-associated protease RseP (regulator of RpoE activity)
MPDQADVEDALVIAAGAACYPGGGPYVLANSIVGANVEIRRGFPLSAALDAALAAGNVFVSVNADKNSSADRTRFDNDWEEIAPPVATLTVTVAADTATFSGAAGVAQSVGIRLGGPSAVTFTAALAATDGPNEAAAAMAAMIPGSAATGSSIQCVGFPRIAARVAGWGTLQREARRQEDVFRLVIYAPSRALRDRVSKAIDLAITSEDWIDLPDETCGRVRYRGTLTNDATVKAADWQRDLIFSVEYAATQTMQAPSILWVSNTVTTARGDIVSTDG